MTKKQSKIYTITLSEIFFKDSSFGKKTTSYIPISRYFLNSKLTESLSLGEFKLMISLIEEAFNQGKSTLKVDEKYIRSQGKVTEKSLSKLSDFNYLTYTVSQSVNQSVSHTKNENNNIETFSSLLPKNNNNEISEKEKNFLKFYEDFVTNGLKTLDTGKIKKWAKVFNAFGSVEGFESWLDQVTSSKNFKEMKNLKEKERYYDAALSKELEARGVK